MTFRIVLDPGDLGQLAADVEERLSQATRTAASELAASIHAHMLEQSSDKLHARRQMFVDALSFTQVDDENYVISLDAKARWIDDGLPNPFDLKPGLLGSPKAKTSRDGGRYLVVPMGHGPGKGAASTTPAQQNLIDTLKSEMKSRKIPWGKVEKDGGGQPKTGLLHSFDVMDKPVKTANAPGQGKGPIGQAMQGPTGIPFLQGVRVYQRAGGSGKVKRAVMTFRTVTSKMGADRWMHPGLAPAGIFDESYEWGLKQWTDIMLVRILDRVIGYGLIA